MWQARIPLGHGIVVQIARLSDSHDKLQGVLIKIRFVLQTSNFGLLLTLTETRASSALPILKAGAATPGAANGNICQGHLKKHCHCGLCVPQTQVLRQSHFCRVHPNQRKLIIKNWSVGHCLCFLLKSRRAPWSARHVLQITEHIRSTIFSFRVKDEPTRDDQMDVLWTTSTFHVNCSGLYKC